MTPPDSRTYYVTVKVNGYDDKNVKGEVATVHTDEAAARDYADRRPSAGLCVMIYRGREPMPRDRIVYPRGWNRTLDQQADVLQRLDENKQEVLVARWDGRRGPPAEGMQVTYTDGWGYPTLAVDRIARPMARTGYPMTEERWVALEWYPGNRPEGRVVGVRNSEEAARACAAERIQEIRQQAKRFASDAIERARFSPRLREIREEYRQTQGQERHPEMNP